MTEYGFEIAFLIILGFPRLLPSVAIESTPERVNIQACWLWFGIKTGIFEIEEYEE